MKTSTDEEERTEIRFKLRAALKRPIEEIRVYPTMPSEEEIESLKAKLDQITNKLNEQAKDRGISTGLKVKANILREKIQKIEAESDELDTGLELIIKSKLIDKIDIRFRGPGITDQDYNEMIKRRTVRLRRPRIYEGDII